MRLLWIGVCVALAGVVVARTRLGVRIGNELRAWSDRLMLAGLRLTSEFERER